MKQFLLTFIFLIIPFACFSEEWTDPETGIKYQVTKIDETNKYVSLYNGVLPSPAPQVIKIPDFYNGYKVTELNINFYGFSGVKKVILPKYLKEISDYSIFHSAYDVEEIVWNTELEKIGQEACDQVVKQREVDLSNTKVTFIGFMAFYAYKVGTNDPQLNSFKLSPCIKELDDMVWGGKNPIKTLTLPASLEKITQYTFQRMEKLEELIFESPTPAAIVKGHSMYSQSPTGDQLFEGCPNLKVVHVPVESSVAYKAAMCWEKTKNLYYEKLTIGTTGYTTYYLENENFLVPAGCTAYIITGVTPSSSITAPDQAQVKAFTAGKIIPKQTGFILQGPANSTVLYQAAVAGTEEDVTGNLLVGTAIEREFSSAGDKYYVLANGNEGIGFYKQGTRKGTSIKLKAHRAGLRLAEAIAPAKGFTIDFEAARKEAETTGIQTVKPTTPAKENIIYDLQGRRVMNPGRGIYIVNGKKVVRE